MSDVRIVCGKFGEQLPQAPEFASSVVRTFPQRKQRHRSPELVIGVDDHTVFYLGRLFTHAEFLQSETRGVIQTMTKREADILLSTGLVRTAITTFEGKYPWVSDIKFVNNSEKNLFHLVSLKQKYQKHLETSGEMADRALKRVVDKVKWKSELDRFFFAAQSHAYQDVFKFTEAREDRTIFAFDFNSMYGACLEGEFPDPKHLMFQEIASEARALKQLRPGIYKCILSAPKNSFIKKFHALRYNTCGQKFGFEFGRNVSAEVLLHREEIEYYMPHFGSLMVEWGVVSPNPISHPLLKNTKQAYAERRNFFAQGNHTLAGKCKFKLATVYSCVAQNNRSLNSFASPSELVRYLGTEYQTVKPAHMSDVQFANYINRLSAFEIRHEQKLVLSSPDVGHRSKIYSLFSPVIAKARVKILRCFEYVLEFEGAEICYSNVDSVHVSVADHCRKEFLEHMHPYLGEQLGSLKLEATAKKGVWFEPGRYWLFSDNKVVKYRNLGIRGKWNPEPFLMAKRHLAIREQFGFLTPKDYYITFMRSLSYRRRLNTVSPIIHLGFDRFNVEDILGASKWMSSVKEETLRSAAVKKEVFQAMKSW